MRTAGDQSFSMAELAAEVSRQIGRNIPYRNLSGDDYAAILLSFGLSQMIVDVIIDADIKSIPRRPGSHISRSQRTDKQAYDNAF